MTIIQRDDIPQPVIEMIKVAVKQGSLPYKKLYQGFVHSYLWTNDVLINTDLSSDKLKEFNVKEQIC